MDAVPTPTAGSRPIRVLVVDDRRPVPAWRAALAEAPDVVVVGETGDGGRCLRLCATLRPDVVVGDLAAATAGADELVRRMTELHPLVQALVVTPYADGDAVRRLLDAGAVGYLLDDVEPPVLVDGVRAVARGESPLDPRAVRAMLRARPTLRGEDLTAREREVLALVMRGLANKQIARELQITDGTVKSHIGSIFTRIGVADRTSAALWAERHLRPEPVRVPLQTGRAAVGAWARGPGVPQPA